MVGCERRAGAAAIRSFTEPIKSRKSVFRDCCSAPPRFGTIHRDGELENERNGNYPAAGTAFDRRPGKLRAISEHLARRLHLAAAGLLARLLPWNASRFDDVAARRVGGCVAGRRHGRRPLGSTRR